MNLLENSKIFVKEVEPLKIHVSNRGIENYCRNELIIISPFGDGRLDVNILPCVDEFMREDTFIFQSGNQLDDVDSFDDIDNLWFFDPENFICFDEFLGFIKHQVNAIETYNVFAHEYTKSKLNSSLYVKLISKLYNIDNRDKTERFYNTLKKDCKSDEYFDKLEKIANCVKAFFGITFN